MLKWIMQWVVWVIARVIITLACIWTIQNIIHQEGYLIDFNILLASAICIIVAVRLWMPSKN